MNERNIRKLLHTVELLDGHVPSLASHRLLVDMTGDDLIKMLLAEVLGSNTSQRDRAEALCRLLGTYGVGTIVEGRLV